MPVQPPMLCRANSRPRPFIQVITAFLLPLAVVAPASSQTFIDSTDLLQATGDAGRPLGASAVDLNADGYVDLYQNKRLYINQGGVAFVDMLAASGLDEGEVAFGAVFGDYTNDGLPDVFFEDLTAPSNVFVAGFNGTYTETTQTSGITTDGLPVQGSIWLDYDNDGRLDLFVGGDGFQDRLFRNRNNSTFIDTSSEIELPIPRQNYGGAAADVNRDGRLDIYIAACSADIDKSRNTLWVNWPGLGFLNAAAGVEDTSDSWGALFFDYNNDGWMDLYVLNSGGGNGRSSLNKLYRYDGALTFKDEAVAAGVSGDEGEQGYSGASADFDNDGWIDLYVLNKRGEGNYLYRNNSDGTFTDVWNPDFTPETASAVAVADLNNDGWVDIFIATDDGGSLFMNDPGDNHWIKVGLRGSQSNYYGVGARVEAYAGDLSQVREITTGEGMTSQNHSFTAHFGLRDLEVLDSLVVRWPSGTVDRYEGVLADQQILAFEGTTYTSVDRAGAAENGAAQLTVAAYPNPFSDHLTIVASSTEVARTTGAVPVASVYDVTGRLVRSLGPATASLVWDGTSDNGFDAPAGVYLLRVASNTSQVTQVVVKR